VRYAFIDGQSDAFPMESLCKAMMVSPSGYANWKARSHGPKPGGKRLSDDHLLTLIRAIHARTKGAYGSPRIYDELKDAGHLGQNPRSMNSGNWNGLRPSSLAGCHFSRVCTCISATRMQRRLRLWVRRIPVVRCCCWIDEIGPRRCGIFCR